MWLPKYLSACLLVFVLAFHALLVSSFATPLQIGQAEEVGVSLERLSLLDEVILAAIEEEELPGAVALVGRRGKVIFRKAYGIRATEPREEALTVDSIFDLASLTKVMATATSIMILVEEGKIALRDRVTEYIPEFEKRRKGRVTVLQLLTHHSGLRPDVDLDVEWRGYDKAIELAVNERLVRDPGEEFIYSDINYFVLAEIVRRVTGQYLDEFARERVFEPLGMADTGFNPPVDRLDRVVPTEERDGEMIRGVVHDPTSFRMGGVAGHAGLFSTADDVAIWAQMILNGGAYGGRRILSPLGVLKMTTPQNPRESSDWRGLGFDIETRFSTVRGDLFPVGSFGHTGFTGTSLWIDPFTDTFVVLLSSRLYPDGEGNVVSLREKVASVVAGALLDVPLIREHYYRNR